MVAGQRSKGSSAPPAKRINLALQGGGAHGAFTWGVLDAFLADPRISIAGISGTSAGAMNAVALADGMVEGGPEGARRQLESFWHAISREARHSPIQRTILDTLLGKWSLDASPGYLWFDLFSRLASPYDFNPLDINPIRAILDRQINFANVRALSQIKLFIAATNVFSGKIAVFRQSELTASHLLASACLPQMFRAVEIDGIPYWDGGYMGNPALFPLFYGTDVGDVVLVQINPIERREVPRTARAIQNRMDEITFNSTLLREMRAIHFVTRLIEDGKLDPKEYMRVRMHRVAADQVLVPLQASSKFNAEWDFLVFLRDAGRKAAQGFLAENFEAIGERSSLDLRAAYD